jgi:hypothetical protein
MSSEKKEKGVIRELTDFFNSSKHFLINCERPDRKGKLYIFTKNLLQFRNNAHWDFLSWAQLDS